jgi:uncharacterized OB-fold protein
VLPYCKRCGKNIWPPSDICRLCFSTLSIENCTNKIGKILEISEPKILNDNNKNILMIVVDINQIVLLGSIFFDQNTNKSSKLKYKQVKIKKCGFINDRIFYEFELYK